jgi:hypothetical protein
VTSGSSTSAYTVLSTEPTDWATAYGTYFTKVGDNSYKAVAGVAPTWEANKYYDTAAGGTAQTEKPTDWETNYGSYYVSDGGTDYVPVTAVAPTFAAGKYYQKKSNGGN